MATAPKTLVIPPTTSTPALPAPWTEVGEFNGHPNGDNNGDVHWAVRRWTVTDPGPLALNYHLRKENTGGGNGTTAILLHNGQQLGRITVAGNDGVGLRSWHFVNAQAGDRVEVALSPRGTDGTDNDGADSSIFTLLVDGFIPPSPFQPDGTPFGSGGGVSTLLDVAYDAGSDSLALSWTNQRGKEYQVPYSATGIAPWTNIGLSFPADGRGTNSETLNALGLPGGTYIFRVLELDP